MHSTGTKCNHIHPEIKKWQPKHQPNIHQAYNTSPYILRAKQESRISAPLSTFILSCYAPTVATYITTVHKLVNHYKLFSHTNCMQLKIATVTNVSKTFNLILQTLTSCQIMTSQSQSFLIDQLLLGHIHVKLCSILQAFPKFALTCQEFPVHFKYQMTNHRMQWWTAGQKTPTSNCVQVESNICCTLFTLGP